MRVEDANYMSLVIKQIIELPTDIVYWSIESIIQLCHNNIDSFEHKQYTAYVDTFAFYEKELQMLCCAK